MPLHPQFVELLRVWLRDLPADQPLFPGLARKKLSNMVRLDLKQAGIPYAAPALLSGGAESPNVVRTATTKI